MFFVVNFLMFFVFEVMLTNKAELPIVFFVKIHIGKWNMITCANFIFTPSNYLLWFYPVVDGRGTEREVSNENIIIFILNFYSHELKFVYLTVRVYLKNVKSYTLLNSLTLNPDHKIYNIHFI